MTFFSMFSLGSAVMIVPTATLFRIQMGCFFLKELIRLYNIYADSIVSDVLQKLMRIKPLLHINKNVPKRTHKKYTLGTQKPPERYARYKKSTKTK